MQCSSVSAKPALTLSDLAASVGLEIAISDWIEIDQARIDAFAACTNDHQWIHCDPQRAQVESPSRRTIAHGFLTLGLLTEMQRDAGAWPVDVVSTVNYGLEGVRFISPVPSGARLRNRTICVSVEPRNEAASLVRLDNTIEIEGGTKPALVARSLLMMFTATGGK